MGIVANLTPGFSGTFDIKGRRREVFHPFTDEDKILGATSRTGKGWTGPVENLLLLSFIK